MNNMTATSDQTRHDDGQDTAPGSDGGLGHSAETPSGNGGSSNFGAETLSDNAGSGTNLGPERARLYRPTDDRMLAGVASGIARFLGVDALVVRIAIVVLTFIGGAGLPLYLACWLLIPEQGAEKSIAADFLDSIQSKR
jgi:phage shock protein PspC (stress-responsive transcriptional regulator)